MIEDWTLDELLAAHAAGRLPAPLALIIGTHLALSPESRAAYRTYEATGGVLLDEIEPAQLKPDAWDRLRQQLGEVQPQQQPPVPEALRHIPRPLRDYIPGSLDRLRWRTRGSVSEAVLDLGTPGYRTVLLRVRAGRAVPQHAHEDGHELTLVLEGSFHDELGHYRRGDLTIADPAIIHRPTVDADADCMCLVVTNAKLRLTGPFSRLLSPFLWH